MHFWMIGCNNLQEEHWLDSNSSIMVVFWEFVLQSRTEKIIIDNHYKTTNLWTDQKWELFLQGRLTLKGLTLKELLDSTKKATILCKRQNVEIFPFFDKFVVCILQVWQALYPRKKENLVSEKDWVKRI